MPTRTSPSYLSQLRPIASGISALFKPYVEVVIHDLATSRVVHIENSYSRRKIGDKSDLQSFDPEAEGDIIGPYEKMNRDGTVLKAISVVHRDEKKKPLALLCINFDTHRLSGIVDALNLLVSLPAGGEHPKRLFKHDLSSLINDFSHRFAKEIGKTIDSFTKEDRARLVRELHKTGAFEEKRAADYIAHVLGVSRASVYNYLGGV
jgi:predicted transcriptional regulator YheO